MTQQSAMPSGRAPTGSEPGVGGAHSTATGTGVSWRENALGDARAGRVANVSWGAIFAGVVTFLAIVLVFSLLTAAAGLDGSGTGAAVVTVIGLLLGFFGGGGVAGAMAVRGGLVHGFLSWATSLLATVLLTVLLAVSAANAVGGVLGSVLNALGSAAGPAIAQVDPSAVPSPSQQQQQQAQQQAQQTAEQARQAAQQAADSTRRGATWGFFGLLLGAVVASIGGLLGSRSVANRKTAVESSAAGSRG